MNEKELISKLITTLNKNGQTDEAILFGLTAAAIDEGKENELHQMLEELLPNYTSTSTKDLLLRNATNQN